MIFLKFIRSVFMFATIVMSLSACSRDSDMPIQPIDTTSIVREFKTKTPLFLDRDIYYRESQSKRVIEKNFGHLTRREIFTIFPSKYVYDALDGKPSLFNLDKADPAIRSSLLKDTSTEKQNRWGQTRLIIQNEQHR